MSVPTRARWLLLALVAGASLVGLLLRVSPPTSPNVVLVVVDTLRADCLDPDAADAPMPGLAALAGGATYYERAYAPSSWTLPSMVSIFLARRPSEHGVGSKAWKDGLPADGSTLAEAFRDAGYATAARVAHPVLDRVRIGRGFDDFAHVPSASALTDATAVTRSALDWLASRSERAPPFFLYLHYMDVHGPSRIHPGLTAPRGPQVGRSDERLGSTLTARALLLPAARRRAIWAYSEAELQRMRQLYEGECRHVDREIASLLDGLRERKLLRRSIVVVTADHGEEFGAHGVFGHGGSLFAAAVRVPLVILVPERAPQRIRAPVEVAGLGPTLLEAIGLDAPADFRAPPLPLRADRLDAGATAYFELLPSHLQVHLHARGIASGTGMLLVADDGSESAYALDGRGLEAGRIDDAETLAALRAALGRTQGALGRMGAPEDAALGDEAIERLRGLGYLE